jgi:hypothetical protein
MKRPAKEHPNPEYWNWLREKIIEERGAKCQAIAHHTREAGYQLELHHTHYNTWGCEKSEDVLLLCNLCHEAITSVQRRERYEKRDISAIEPIKIVPDREVFIVNDEKHIDVVKQQNNIPQRGNWR